MEPQTLRSNTGHLTAQEADVIRLAASRGLAWLQEQEPQTVKDISRSIQALSLLDGPASIHIMKLISQNILGCEWLIRNYGPKWEHAGTTSLIITALIKQDREKYGAFIKERASWLLSKREDSGWTYIATSNLVIQALILARVEEKDIAPSIKWLLGKPQENGSWKDKISTTLSFHSLKMYLDKLN